MRIFFYDHNVNEMPDADRYISIDYLDDARYNHKNHILTDANCSFIDAQNPEKDFFDMATSDLADFSNIKFEGKTVKEIISVDGLSLWWLYEAGLRQSYAQYLKHKHMIKIALDQLEMKEAIANIRNPVILVALEDYLRTRSICIKRDMREQRGLGTTIRSYEYNIGYILKYALAAFVAKFSAVKGQAPLLIVSYTNYWTGFNVTKDIKKDGIFNEIQRGLEKRDIKYLGIEHHNDSLKNFVRARVEKRMVEKGLWIPLARYMNAGILRDSLNAYRAINESVLTLKFEGDGQKFIFKRLKSKLKESLLNIIDLFCFEEAVSRVMPKAILISCEYCTGGRMATMVGNKGGIATIALQHGVITNTSTAYVYDRSESPTLPLNVNSRPLPRYTLVYGSIYRDILVKESIYPADSVAITGQPRYDVFSSADERYSRLDFFRKMGLDPKKKLIFCTTDGLPESRVEKNAYGLFKVAKSMENSVQLLIKPHPNNMDRDLYFRIKDELGVDALIESNLNLYEAIYSSDVVVTWFSTTAVEAILLNRPVIVLNLTSEPDYTGYVSEEVAFGAHSEETFATNLNRIFDGVRCPEDKRAAFIDKYVYRIDGKASARVIDLVAECLKGDGKSELATDLR
jgi:hypothetical protein